jgi:plasmid stability protein
MATLTVRNLDDETVRRLRIRAAEHGRSAEAEHREILRAAVADEGPLVQREQIAARLAEFRRRTARPGSETAATLLAQSRTRRLASLVGPEDAR